MGFYFRKSIKIGNSRINLSKSGVSYSYGIKGFRISTSSRGTYLTVGSNGFYYRERLDKSKKKNKIKQRSLDYSSSNNKRYIDKPGTIKTADVAQLVETSSEKIISDINNHKKEYVTLLVTILVFSLLLVVDIFVFNYLGFLAITLCSLIFIPIAFYIDNKPQITVLFYDLDGELAKRFTTIQAACIALSQTNKIWRVESKQENYDWRRNAGAASLLSRNEIKICQSNPPYIKTNVDVWMIDIDLIKLYFFPDYIFVLQDNKYGAVSYESLNAKCYSSNFIEYNTLPLDCQILNYTWQYVRKNGQPDKRFSNNRKIPIVLYGDLVLTSETGMNIHLQVSNLELAQEFVVLISKIKNRTQESYGQNSQKSQDDRKDKYVEDIKDKTPYEIIGISVNSTREEIMSAYQRMAKMYHPDKVATLGKEFRDLAESKMKEINHAYEILKSTSNVF
jgi:hypothetical protein